MFENDPLVEVMLSKALIGKAPLEWGRREWAAYYRTFRHTKLTPRALAAAIWHGYAFAPVYSSGRRIEANFSAAWHIGIDLDTQDETSSLDYIMRPGTFAWTFCSFAYTTPSHTEEKPKGRVVFILENPITEAEEMRAAYQAVAWYMSMDGHTTDRVCKDPLRLYYGSPNCTVSTNWSVLTDSTLAYISEAYVAAHPPPPPPGGANRDGDPPGEGVVMARLRALADNIAYAPDGQRHRTRRDNARAAGGYVGAGHTDIETAVSVLLPAALGNTETPASTIEEQIRQGVEYGISDPLHIDAIKPPGAIQWPGNA